jgi:hypothetical protein
MQIWLGKQLLKQRENWVDELKDTREKTDWRNLIDVAQTVFNGKYSLTPFHRWLLSKMTKFVMDFQLGLAPRLHISLPPQHGKSEAVRLACAWALDMCGPRVAWASYNVSFARKSSRIIRDWFQEHKPDRFGKRTKSSEGEWSLDPSGTFLASGVRSQLVGEPVDLMFLDDLLKSYEEYCSTANRERVQYFLKTVVATRLNNSSGILSIGTRWGQDDSIDMIMAELEGKWEYYAIPAIAGENDILGRAKGEALWEERQSAKILTERMRLAGPIIAAAVYQQAPLQVSGMFFKRDTWGKIDKPLDVGNRSIKVRYWDLAFTKGGHGTSGALGYLHKAGSPFFVEDVLTIREEWPTVRQRIIRQAKQDGIDVQIGIEANGTQIGYYQELIQDLPGYKIFARKSKPDKSDDARRWQSLQWGGNVLLGTVDRLIDRAERFPENDIDEIDAISGCYWLLRILSPAGNNVAGGW